MSNNKQAEAIAQQFGFEATPESVQRLNQLLNKRDASPRVCFAPRIPAPRPKRITPPQP
jgi:hypothetical protein